MRWLNGIIDSMDMSLSNLGDGEGQGGLMCCSPWGRKKSDTTERLNNKLSRNGLSPPKTVSPQSSKSPTNPLIFLSKFPIRWKPWALTLISHCTFTELWAPSHRRPAWTVCPRNGVGMALSDSSSTTTKC